MRARTRRADQAQDLALRGPAQAPHGDELQDAVLHVCQPVVVLVQHLRAHPGQACCWHSHSSILHKSAPWTRAW